MRKLIFIILSSLLMIVPFVSAIPDAPESVWLTGIENIPYDNNGIITVNWDPVVNEAITRYNIYVVDAATKKTVLVGTNTTATTFVFSGYSSGNYTFNVTAVNTLNEIGFGRKSDWVLIHTEKPVIVFKAPTPENNRYTKYNWTTISGSITDTFPEYLMMNWNGADNLQTYLSGTLWMFTFDMPTPGKYSYYVWANDSAGNSIKSETRYITYDITKPAVALISPQRDAIYDVASISIEYTATDIGPVSCWYSYNSINTTLAGCMSAKLKPVFGNTTTFTLWVNDSAGNINSASATFSVKSPPSPTILLTVPVNGTVLEAPSITGKATDTFTIKTDRPSTCKYDLVPNTSYNLMHSSFKSLSDNMHAANFTAGDNKSHVFYIRCKSAEYVINTEDYILKISTKYPEGLIIVDPEKKVLNNNGFKIESMIGKTAVFNLPIKTRAAYTLTKYAAKTTGDGASYLKATMPKSLTNSSLENLTLSVSAKKSGNFKATVNLSSGTYSTTFLVDLVVFDDFISGLNDMSASSINLSARIENLKLKGTDVSDKEAELGQIQSGMEEVRTLYKNNAYSEARDNYIGLSDSYTILKQEVSFAETGKRSVSINSSESGSSSGIGGSSLTTIVIAVIVVIIVIIVVTSILSNKEESSADVASATPIVSG